MKYNSQLNRENILYKVFLFILFLILLLPAINLSPWLSPSNWIKTIIFRCLMCLIIGLSFFNLPEIKNKFLCIWQNKKLKIGLLSLFILFFLGFLSTAFSLDKIYSLWEDPTRGDGFINLIFYIILALFSFLFLKEKDWKNVFDFSIIVGVIVSIIAIFQQFGIFVPQSDQLSTTLGSPMFLGMYLLFLIFIVFISLIREKSIIKKVIYLIPFFLFSYVVYLTNNRASFLGIVFGIIYFFLFYPTKNNKIETSSQNSFLKKIFLNKLFLIKISAGFLLSFSLIGMLLLKNNPEIKLNQNKHVQNILSSITMDESRLSAWKVSFKAVLDKPILGFGPENFSIGFDKFYDPSLPLIQQHPYQYSSWWDKAHNFIFNIAVTMGIPALICYLFLFGFLFFELQKIKKVEPVAHVIQTIFLAYFVANLFSFDGFSSYLISFLLVGYSFFLILNNNPNKIKEEKDFLKNIHYNKNWPKIILTILFFFGLIWFIWTYNIKLIPINTQINIAQILAQHKLCDQAILVLEKQFKNHSILDHFLRLEYGEMIRQHCLDNKSIESTKIFAEKIRNVLLENTKIRPYYTRNWLLLGTYTNILIETENDTAKKKDLIIEANNYLERANQLSPKRQEVFIEWTQTNLLSGEYKKAKEKAQKCVDSNDKLNECWWYLGLTNIYLNEIDLANENIQTANQKGFDINSKNAISQLIRAYSIKENYQKVIDLFPQLISLDPTNLQYRTSLAFLYKELGYYNKARTEALEVLRLAPEKKLEIEEFLNSLE